MLSLFSHPAESFRLLHNFDRSWDPHHEPRIALREPNYSLHDEETQVRLVMLAPGLSPNDIAVSVTDRELSVEFSLPEQSRKLLNSQSQERVRRFTLPKTLNTEGIAAELTNGVLTVLLPKVVPPQPRRIAVNAVSAEPVATDALPPQ